MKNILVLILAFVPVIISAQGWSQLNVGTTENLNKVYFKNNSEGFIIGDNGTLIKTTDGGINWIAVSTGVTNNLRTISFLNDTIGYINGLKTTDGGNTWLIQTASQNFGPIYAQDTNNLIAGLYNNLLGDIYSSSDGGDNWAVIANPIFGSTGFYDDVSFVNDTVGYLSAWYSAHLVKTIDGGYNWTEVIIDTVDGSGFSTDDFRSVDFLSVNVGVLTHQDGFLQTLDAGSTWSEIRPTNFSGSFYPRSVITNTADNYIVVGNSIGALAIEKIYETNDGGATWTLTNNTIEDLYDVGCIDSSCFAVGSNGTVFKKENGTLGLVSLNDESQISIYPNPTTGYLYINLSGISTEKIGVFDMVGRELHLPPSAENKIDASTLPSGAYLLKIIDREKTHTIKFIKK